MSKNIQKGFTLVELLVVISVIGVLATMVILSLNRARVKARDIKRKNDITQIAKALEIFYDENGVYPADTFGGWEQPCVTATNDIGQLVTQGLLASLPCDPLNTGSGGNGYGYYYDENYYPPSTYCLYTNLEQGGNFKISGGSYGACP